MEYYLGYCMYLSHSAESLRLSVHDTFPFDHSFMHKEYIKKTPLLADLTRLKLTMKEKFYLTVELIMQFKSFWIEDVLIKLDA